MRYLLGAYLSVDPKNVHAYVIGEHGDSEMVPWSQAIVGTKPIREVVAEHQAFSENDLQNIATEVRRAAYQIIEAKGATYYGIGLSLVRIVKAVFGGENSILTVSARLDTSDGIGNVYAGVPCILGHDGVREVLRLKLEEKEKEEFLQSCRKLKEVWEEMRI